MGIEEAPSGFLLTTIEDLAGYLRKASLWPVTFGLACCAIEMMAAGASRFDLSRFGMEVFRASPRQADLMIVAGRVSQKMAPVVRQVYDQMSEPKWVLSMGVCASSGGMFNNYAIVQGVDHVVPVDIYLPGCPPRPEMRFSALRGLREPTPRAPRGPRAPRPPGPGRRRPGRTTSGSPPGTTPTTTACPANGTIRSSAGWGTGPACGRALMRPPPAGGARRADVRRVRNHQPWRRFGRLRPGGIHHRSQRSQRRDRPLSRPWASRTSSPRTTWPARGR